MESPNLITRVLSNPYPHIFPSDTFDRLIHTIGEGIQGIVESRHMSGEFKRPSLGMCLINPAKPARRGTEGVLALITIGPEGPDYLANAVAKAVTHHNTGQDCGIAAYVEPYRLPDGSFCYGHSAEVAGTIAGASALSEAQDRLMATILAAEFNYTVTAAHEEFKKQHPEFKWFCNQNEPLKEFSDIAALIHEADITLGPAEYATPSPGPSPDQHD